MKKGLQDGKWREILKEFSAYKGTITGFCKKNNLSKDTFYYYKKKFEKADSSIFHAVAIKKDAATAVHNSSEHIRIEIGKAVILIPSGETSIFSDIIKELVKIC